MVKLTLQQLNDDEILARASIDEIFAVLEDMED